MSGSSGALLGLSLAGIVTAALDIEEASAACTGSFLLLCLFVREYISGVTTRVSFVLAAGLFVGLLAGGGATAFLVINAVLFLSTTLAYVIP